MQTATIKTVNLEIILEKIDKLNKSFKRYNHPLITYTVTSENERVNLVIDTILGQRQVQRVITFHYVEIEFEVFKIGNHRLIATLDHVENLVNVAPKEMLPSEFFHIDAKCDHCQTSHQRNRTIILQHNDTGEYIQLGTSCVAKYIGIDASNILSLTAIFHDFRELLESDFTAFDTAPRSRGEFHLEDYISASVCAVEKWGWNNSNTPRPTKNDALDILSDKDLRREITEEHSKLAEEIIVWMGTLENSSNPYQHNLYNISLNGFVTYHSYGLAASAVVAYSKHLENEASKKAINPSQHFGEIKKRYDLELQVTFVLALPSMYGTNYMHIMRDEFDNVFKWVATNGTCFESGDMVHGKATVTEHTEYNGVKQTVLQRCKFELS